MLVRYRSIRPRIRCLGPQINPDEPVRRLFVVLTDQDSCSEFASMFPQWRCLGFNNVLLVDDPRAVLCFPDRQMDIGQILRATTIVDPGRTQVPSLAYLNANLRPRVRCIGPDIMPENFDRALFVVVTDKDIAREVAHRLWLDAQKRGFNNLLHLWRGAPAVVGLRWAE